MVDCFVDIRRNVWLDNKMVECLSASSRIGSVEGALSPGGGAGGGVRVHGWTLEQCLLAACTGQPIACPAHGAVPLQHAAPDAVTRLRYY